MYFSPRIPALLAVQGHVTLKIGVVSKDHITLSTFKLKGILSRSYGGLNFTSLILLHMVGHALMVLSNQWLFIVGINQFSFHVFMIMSCISYMYVSKFMIIM